jgi:LmbE family N-acetylglucosaminyl deacetylase
VRVVADRVSYDVGDEVSLSVFLPSSGKVLPPADFLVTLRYAGEDRPVLDQVMLPPRVASGVTGSTGYSSFWRVPADARAGRYEIDLLERDRQTRQAILNLPRAASFAVHRKLVQIASVEVAQTNYTSGDGIGCGAMLENLSDRPLQGLRVEFSERYWPWIAQQTKGVGTNIQTLGSDLALKPHERVSVASSHCAVAKSVKQPAIQQFAVVVWDSSRKDIYDIAISQLVFVHPPGVETPQPYPPPFMYSDLNAVNTTTYRDFFAPGEDSGAIQFDHEHTMFPLEGEATVHFSVRNPTEHPWHGVSIRARLRAPGRAGFEAKALAQNVDLTREGPPLRQVVTFKIPKGPPGLYGVQVELLNSAGQVFADRLLEIATNPLPKSILIFCAHEDDEGAHAGIIRAAVENRIPLHVVYFTSGDAGSCDRYYQHSCRPAEALNFGALRMEEARRALGHLGVPREDIYFLGLPDGGSGQIWFHHLEPSNPYLAVLLASDHAPYEGLVRPNLPYARRAVVEAVKEIIRKFQPQVIITAHPPAEGHIDHIVNNYFVVAALQELSREGSLPPGLELRVDRIYDPKEHPSTPYHYQEHSFAISGEAAARAREAGWFYQSQGGNRSEGNFRSFSQLPRAQRYRVVIDWKEHEGWNEKD